MGVRSGSTQMAERSSSEVGLVSSLMKSWRIASSSVPTSSSSSSPSAVKNHSRSPSKKNSNSATNNNSSKSFIDDGNFCAMSKQKNSTTTRKSSSSYSPLRYVSPTLSSIDSPKSSFFRNQYSKHHNQSYYQHGNNHSTSTLEKSNTDSIKHDKYFQDLDEDWSAVIDDYNMPIPTLTNGGNASPIPQSNTSRSRPNLTRSSTSSSIATNAGLAMTPSLQYPKLPSLSRTESPEVKSQAELENEREAQELTAIMQRIDKFDCILQSKHIINQQELKEISWNGVPKPNRPKVWKILIGYLPLNIKRQDSYLKRKRQEYVNGLNHISSNNHSKDTAAWHQIEIDIPRTNPHISLYQFKSVQNSLQKVLYLWAIRHPASGYVQGINDLVTPFFEVFLTEYLSQSQIDDVENIDPQTYLTEEQWSNLEADTFWCLTKLLEQITDNYIHGQPGILEQVKNLSQLVKRIDSDLYDHFQKEHVEFIQFSFRWMNCLLMREFQMGTVIRMWDTYLAETSTETTNSIPYTSSNEISLPKTPIQRNASTFSTPVETTSPSSYGRSAPVTTSNTTSVNSDDSTRLRQSSLNEFHVFVCAAFLIKWSEQLLDMDFQGIITFLQNPPTKDWTETDIEMLLSEAYIWQSLYKDATSHWL
ncbi:hypothetical protein KAFR_0D02420 [Kazachstania africana CBS 2517]|uniref:Rab-GAP TBC domain-containing protein n=1 Tax=Kazachstania africana (strain ATCC 22294 / BCRC 22015 / CBS 2517 / CECT 1963 / NBRC 1671 / NRRL Y-8276) TaxID=1071382 RepID=H2AU39_KAZAF|nr:hypothetical protein KAFR_0D02420 [Kazachstania africana CBS 2517]CCF57889.1 hypothetical protein KAFR_0D02420 [Kazachstania africana CBS 2517]